VHDRRFPGESGEYRQARDELLASEIALRLVAHANGRGWRNLRLLSSANNSYNRDYHAEEADGSQNAMATAFVRRAGRIHHFSSSELWFVPPEAGQNLRHFMWPLWSVLDRTAGGRGAGWYPKLEYD
jgi:predicted dithiol-disulfide oxidoreductase (DUF899 family)